MIACYVHFMDCLAQGKQPWQCSCCGNTSPMWHWNILTATDITPKSKGIKGFYSFSFKSHVCSGDFSHSHMKGFHHSCNAELTYPWASHQECVLLSCSWKPTNCFHYLKTLHLVWAYYWCDNYSCQGQTASMLTKGQVDQFALGLRPPQISDQSCSCGSMGNMK